MMRSFEILQLDDNLLHAVVLTLDRYYARRVTPMDEALLQRVLLSAVCTEMKITSSMEFPADHWQHLLTHLCQGRVSLAAILRTELDVLSRLGFVVGVPTPLAFLRGLSIRLRAAEEAPKWQYLAGFLLELTLFDADLEYTYSHVILAAAALGASYRAFAAPAERHQDLLEDLSTYLPDTRRSSEVDLFACQEEILTLWVQCSAGAHEWVDFFRPLQAKLNRRLNNFGGLAMSPPEALRNLQEARSGFSASVPTEICAQPGDNCSGSTNEAPCEEKSMTANRTLCEC